MISLMERMLDRGETLVRRRGALIGLLGAGALVLTAAGARNSGPLAGGEEPALAILVPMSVVLAAVACAGVAAPELRRGAALLWLQKPGVGARLYVGRLGERLILGLCLGLLLAGAQAAVLGVALGHHRAGAFLATAIPVLPFLVILGGAVTWVMSAAGAEGDAALALLFLPLWMLSATLVGEWTTLPEAVGRWVEVTAPPRAMLVSLLSLGDGGGVPEVVDVVHYLAWVGSLVFVGTGLLHSRLKSPFPGDRSR